MSPRLSAALMLTATLHVNGETGIPGTTDQVANSARTYIPHSLEVPSFTPPAPVVPKQVPAMRVDSAVTVPTTASRTLTLIRGEASTLPDIPVPPVVPLREPRILTAAERDRIIYRRRHTLHFGAMVYDQRVSRVHWSHPDTGVQYEAVCGLDFGLLAGIGSFIHGGETYSLMFNPTLIDTAKSRRRPADIPDALAGAVTLVKGDAEDPVGTAPVAMLAELIANEKARLTTYQADRREHQQAADAWHKAHPPVQRDETFWFKPHRGSRYLANPRPEAALK